ncbi:MAG: hypothetical protein E7236_06115 [Lachnospiraceae bacterium]|nr:hypothetical protein [Lachnospiraceae bacterium]
MTDFQKELLKTEQKLTSLLNTLDSDTTPVIDGRLRIANKQGKPVYYHDVYLKADGSKNLKRRSFYIKKRDFNKAAMLAQQDYNEKLHKATTRQLSQVKSLIKASHSFDEKMLEKVFTQMTPYRKELIKPLVPDQETFVAYWLNTPFTKKQFSELDPEIFTENGEQVRSKSEKIIADKYLKLGIPYRYESQLVLIDNGRSITIYPDFTVLNKNTRKVYYHEHFGRMDKEDYCDSALKRVELYAKNGIFIGDRLIITHETAGRPMNMSYFESLIKKYLSE